MKKSVIAVCGLALLALLLAPAPAEALIPCEDCWFGRPPESRCIGFQPCPGVSQQTNCREWVANNCPMWEFQASEEAFLLSLAQLPPVSEEELS